jgi:hypothetical protein
MSNKVFANMMEVSCKAAAGKSICAMPDVCFTPPQTPATPPGVPIPYPNTGMASDCTSGSTTVKISGQEVMLKNKSYFKKSTGDEAGCAPKKGLITSKNTGKVYFTVWSMDVKVEGENVVRHMDLTTHNHASLPGNSPPWMYADTMAMQVNNTRDPCKSTREEAEAKCGKHLEPNKIKTGKNAGNIKIAPLRRAMCADAECKQAMKCVMAPYSFGCCDGKTPHHVIPAHCFMPPGERGAGGKSRYTGCEKYDPKAAPCVCVTGKDKSKKRLQHARIHKHFDAIEDSHKPESGAGTWSYNEAADAGAESVNKVMGCDEDCTKAQLNKYHNKDSNIPKGAQLRADSSGSSTPPPSLTVVTPRVRNI